MFIKNALFIIIICLSISQYTNGQSPDWEWVNNHGWIGGVGGFGSIDVDNDGNVFMANSFASSNLTLGGITISNNSWNDNSTFCLVKYDSLGNVLWAKTAGGYFNYIRSKSIVTDNYGDVYVTGLFRGDSIVFGQVVLRSPFSNGLYDNIFLVKYSTNGNPLWGICANSTTSAGSCEGKDITVDANNNLLLAGNFTSSNIIFNNDTIYNSNTSARDDMFLLKFDSNGNILWSKGIGGQSYDEVNSVCNMDNYSYITGYFSSINISFDDIVLNNQDSSGYRNNVFIAKLDNNGNFIWAKSNSTDKNSEGVCIDSKKNNLIYFSGNYESDQIIFGLDTLYNNYNNEKLFISALDTAGNFIWAKSSSSNYDENVNDISADIFGNILLIGEYDSGSLIFDSTVLYNLYTSYLDIFIVKYNSEGDVIWAKSLGGDDNDFGKGITNFNGIPYFVGLTWSPSIAFGSNILIPNSGGYSEDDILLGKLSGNCTENSIESFSGNDFALEGETVTFSVIASGSPIINYQWYKNNSRIYGANSSIYTIPDLNSYYDEAVISCVVSNCDYSNSSNVVFDTLNVCSPANPYMYVLNAASISIGDSAVIMIYDWNGSSPINYQWYLNDSLIEGADSSIYVTTNLTESDNGNVYYCITSNCEGLSNVQSASYTVNFPLGIDNINHDLNSKELFPNPAKNNFFVEVAKSSNYKLYSIDGSLVLEGNLQAGKNRIDTSIVESGIYLFEVENNIGKRILKIVVTK